MREEKHMGQRFLIRLLSPFGVKLSWKPKPKRDKYEMNRQIIIKADLLKMELDGIAIVAKGLVRFPSEENVKRMEALEKRTRRIYQKLQRYRRLQVRIIGY